VTRTTKASQHETCAPSENPSVPSPSTVTTIENSVKDTIAADHPLRKLAMSRTLTDEEQKSFTELQARIKMYSRTIPELRLTFLLEQIRVQWEPFKHFEGTRARRSPDVFHALQFSPLFGPLMNY